MATRSRPGPVPLPPADFERHAIPVRPIPEGTLLFRIHLSRSGALYFGPRANPEQRGRWDSPDDQYGVCYLAETGHAAFAETMLRELERSHLSEGGDLGPRSLTTLRVVRPLVLARMHGAGSRRMRADASAVQGPYEVTWSWSRAMHGHPDRVDGIAYRTRHDDDEYRIALFDRAKDAVSEERSVSLLDAALAADLGRWLDRYEIALIP